jgi:hypothetical protein
VKIAPECGDASACLKLRTPVIRRGHFLQIQPACQGDRGEIPRRTGRTGLRVRGLRPKASPARDATLSLNQYTPRYRSISHGETWRM